MPIGLICPRSKKMGWERKEGPRTLHVVTRKSRFYADFGNGISARKISLKKTIIKTDFNSGNTLSSSSKISQQVCFITKMQLSGVRSEK